MNCAGHVWRKRRIEIDNDSFQEESNRKTVPGEYYHRIIRTKI